MAKIFFVMGKSGSGKDTIFKQLKEDESLGLRTVVGYTTRPKREGEKDGSEYFFVTEDRLEELKNAGKVIECRGYNTVCGLWNYFTVDDGQIDLKLRDYLYIGTLESYIAMQRYYGKDRVFPIYIEVEDGERLQRAVSRERAQKEPKYAELCRRFLSDSGDFSEEKLREAGIEKRYQNDDLKRCVDEIKNVIRSEKI